MYKTVIYIFARVNFWTLVTQFKLTYLW